MWNAKQLTVRAPIVPARAGFVVVLLWATLAQLAACGQPSNLGDDSTAGLEGDSTLSDSNEDAAADVVAKDSGSGQPDAGGGLGDAGVAEVAETTDGTTLLDIDATVNSDATSAVDALPEILSAPDTEQPDAIGDAVVVDVGGSTDAAGNGDSEDTSDAVSAGPLEIPYQCLMGEFMCPKVPCYGAPYCGGDMWSCFYDPLEDGAPCVGATPCQIGTCQAHECQEVVDTCPAGECQIPDCTSGSCQLLPIDMEPCTDGTCHSGSCISECQMDEDCSPSTNPCKVAFCKFNACVEFPKSNCCGDGEVDYAEVCDDGDADEFDDCTSLCQANPCGDGKHSNEALCFQGTRGTQSSYVFASWQMLQDVNADGNADYLARTPSEYLLRLGPTFSSGATGSGSGIEEVAVGDINGDGIVDLLIAFDTNGTWSLRARYGLPGGTFEPAPGTLLPLEGDWSKTWNYTLADVNADGFADLLTSGGSFAVRVRAGPLATNVTFNDYQLMGSYTQYRVAHLDADNTLDLIFSDECGGPVCVLRTLLGTQQATFTLGPAWPYDFEYSEQFHFADLDGDGLDDVAQLKSSGITTRRNKGDGTLGPAHLVYAAPPGSLLDRGFSVTNLDTDNHLDAVTSVRLASGWWVRATVAGPLLTTTAPVQYTSSIVGFVYEHVSPLFLGKLPAVWGPGGSIGYSGVTWYTPLTLGQLGPEVLTSEVRRDLLVGDYDGDGSTEILANLQQGGLATFSNLLAQGKWGTKLADIAVLPDPTAPASLRTGKFNGDNKADVLAVQPVKTQVSGSWYTYARTCVVAAAENAQSFKTLWSEPNCSDVFASADLTGDDISEVVTTDPADPALIQVLSTGSNGQPTKQIWAPAIGWIHVLYAYSPGPKQKDRLFAAAASGVFELIAAPDGTLQSTQKLAVAGPESGIAVADLTQDGEPDLVLFDGATDELRFFVGPIATAQPVVLVGKIMASSYDARVEVRDLNGDGWDDFVVLSDSWAGSGSGVANAHTTCIAEPNANTFACDREMDLLDLGWFALHDVNSDGAPDLIAAGEYGVVLQLSVH